MIGVAPPTVDVKEQPSIAMDHKRLRIFLRSTLAVGARALGMILVLLLSAGRFAAQPGPGFLQGQVIDPSGATIPGATVRITSVNGDVKTTATDKQGRYQISLTTGEYSVIVVSRGFGQFESPRIDIVAGVGRTLDVHLQIEQEIQSITVSDTTKLDLDPSQNASQITLKGNDLDALSDDTDDLAKDLLALAGPATGPEGPQIYIDGFTDGRLPPKESIREVRVNQNPFSAEFDRVGFGRIEIFTKPGADKYHGQGFFDFTNRALTARYPYLSSPIVPPYQQELFGGNLGGPLSKKSSFFLDAERRAADDNTLVNYTYLDSALNPVSVNSALLAPSRRFNISPRVDYALTPNHTLVVRYSYLQNNAQNQGLSTQTFDLASRAYQLENTEQNVQLSETAVLGTKVVNSSRLQFFRTRSNQVGVSSAPEISVQGAFTGGGTFPLNYTDRNRYEFQNYTTAIQGVHTIRFGVRWRGDQLQQESATNFNGRFIFSAAGPLEAIDVYRQNQLLAAQGVPQPQIAAQGFGPSEFLLTTGKLLNGVNQFDVGLFAQDDWRVKPNLTLSVGVRYEAQNTIRDPLNLAPRIGLAWAPRARRGGSPKTVIRAGSGIFYDRFTSDLVLNATQLNGVNQTQYIIRNPSFFPNIPDAATLLTLSQQQAGTATSAVYRIDPHIHIPYLIQNAAAIERQLPHNISLAVNYSYTRGLHQLRTRDINAPLPTTFDSQGHAAGPRPLSSFAGDVYQYEGSGVFNQNQVIVSMNAKINRSFSLFGYYVYSRAMSDTDGPNTMPSNPYDLRSEYSRAAFDNRHRAFVSGNVTAPLGIRLSPFIFLQSGRPYNVISGVDNNNDGSLLDDRPAFAQNLSRSSVINQPGIGAFDTAPASLPNAVLVPRNYLEGPGLLSITVRVSRSWTFGEPSRGGGNTGSDEVRGGAGINGGGANSSQTSLAGVFAGAATKKPYSLTLSVSFRNLLNNVNPATPIGNLSSTFFGKSVALSTFGPLPGLPNTASGNRRIELQMRLTF